MWIASSYKLALYYCDSNLSLVWFGFGSVWVGSGWTRLDLARLEKLTCPCWFSPIFCFPKTPVAIDFSSESIKSTANAIFWFFVCLFFLFQVWNTSTCEFVRTLNGHKRGIACLQYRDRLVVSGSSDNTIRWAAGALAQKISIISCHSLFVHSSNISLTVLCL